MSDFRHRWLCIAYAFPPTNRSGTQRTLGFVRHLADLGWDASVITASGAGEPQDDNLLAAVPTVTRVSRVAWKDRVAACKELLRIAEPKVRWPREARNTTAKSAITNQSSPRDWFTRLLHLPDSRSGWIRPAIRAGMETIQNDAPRIIYSTSPYMSAHLVALKLQRRTGLPWVADFRDPWRDNPFRKLDYRSLDWLDARMERAVLQAANHLVMNTATARDRLCARYPQLAAKCSVILNGYDADSFESVTPVRDADANQYVIAHAGQFYGSRSPVPYFRALRMAVEQTPALAATLRLHLIGADRFDGKPLADLARQEGVENLVRVIGPLLHVQTLQRLAGADALLLAGSDGPGADLQVPAKLFEYLALRRPVIAAIPRENPAVDILHSAKVPLMMCQPTDTSQLANAMAKAATTGFPLCADPWSGVDQFDRKHRAAQLLAIFERLTNNAAATPSPLNAPTPAMSDSRVAPAS